MIVCCSCFTRFIKFFLTQQLSATEPGDVVLPHSVVKTVETDSKLLAGKRAQTCNLHYSEPNRTDSVFPVYPTYTKGVS